CQADGVTAATGLSTIRLPSPITVSVLWHTPLQPPVPGCPPGRVGGLSSGTFPAPRAADRRSPPSPHQSDLPAPATISKSRQSVSPLWGVAERLISHSGTCLIGAEPRPGRGKRG